MCHLSLQFHVYKLFYEYLNEGHTKDYLNLQYTKQESSSFCRTAQVFTTKLCSTAKEGGKIESIP